YGSEADEAVKGRHELRHGGHRHAARDIGADTAANAESGRDQNPAQARLRRRHPERGQNGEGHAQHAISGSAPRAFGAGEAAQGENEENARGQIEQRDEIRRHGCSYFFSFFLYMASIRLVTRKPPKMFTAAMTRARKPKTFAIVLASPIASPVSTATASRAPTTITDEIAFVTDISGV